MVKKKKKQANKTKTKTHLFTYCDLESVSTVF